MPTGMELSLEQTQQGVSYEVSVLSDIEDSHGPSDAMHNPLPATQSRKDFVSKSHGDTLISIDFLTPTGNPVKKILLKLNLSDHRSRTSLRILKDTSTMEVETSATLIPNEVLKLNNFKKDATLKLSKSPNQERQFSAKWWKQINESQATRNASSTYYNNLIQESPSTSTSKFNSASKLSKMNIEIAKKIEECQNDEDFARVISQIRSSPTPSEDLFQDSQDPYDGIDL
ncbi:hypothetical protein Tco_1437923 [Tanacetum coccineum]